MKTVVTEKGRKRKEQEENVDRKFEKENKRRSSKL